MTTAEIKALVAKPLLKPVNCREKAMFAAIETLLARQAEVLEWIVSCRVEHPHGWYPMSLLKQEVNEILNPENENDFAMPAAGPWRYDVENAPSMEWLAVWYADHPRDWYKARLGIEGYWETVYYKETRTPIAFATINPPEIEG